MTKKVKKNNIKIFFGISFLFILGVLISHHKGYGDDLDSHALILTFINIIENGYYSASRYYGHPFGELFYGFLSYFFGSFISVFISYTLFIFSLYLLFNTLVKKNIFKSKIENFFIFLLICISNPVLFLDNTNPSDATLSLFFFSLGYYLFRKNFNLYCTIFFGLMIATRANYSLIFIGLVIYEFFNSNNNKKLIKIFILSFIIGFLFYFPILIQNKFSLSFISNPGGPELELISLLPRFIFKTYISYGIFSIFAIIYLIILYRSKLNKFFLINKSILILIFLNLVTFFFMPTKTSIISLAIILTYVLIINLIDNKKILLTIILLNLCYYFISYQIFDFKYKYKNPCDAIEAISASIHFRISEGYFEKRSRNLKNKIKCDSERFGLKSKNYLNGLKIINNY